MKMARANIEKARDGARKLRDACKEGSVRWDAHTGTWGNYDYALTEIDAGLTRLRGELTSSKIQRACGLNYARAVSVRDYITALLPSPAKPTEKERTK